MPKTVETSPSKRRAISRDSVILATALVWGTVEILFLGARPSVLTLVASFVVAPAAIRYDERRRQEANQ